MAQSLGTLNLFPGDAQLPRPKLSASSSRGNKLWIAAHFPALALETLPAADAGKPTVIVEALGRHAHVVAANDKAIGSGINPGIKLSAALGLDDSLNVVTRCPEIERSKLERLAALAKRFTPVVSLEPPAALLLEIGGSLKLFGGAIALKNRLADLLQSQHVTFRLCIAPTALAAIWLARSGREDVLSGERLADRLSQVPLEVTDWPDKTRALLKNMGVRTLGDCMRLPRAGFARRVGPGYLQELDRARGGDDLRLVFEPPLELVAHAELGNETSSTTMLLPIVKQLVASLVEDLRTRQLRMPGFDCVFHHLGREARIERIGFSGPTRDEERCCRLLMDRLEQIRLDAPVIALTLRACRAEPGFDECKRLFAEAPDGVMQLSECGLIERLQARFGVENLYCLDLADEHRPEAAWIKSRRFYGQGRKPPKAVGRLPQRPLWILPTPRRLHCTIDNLPCYEGRKPLRIEPDPERIESGWWDGREIGRDYYMASDGRGGKLWIFQERHPGRGWYLHGFFG